MNPYAILVSGGKQHQVKLGDLLEVEKLSKPGKTVTFDQVLLVVDGDKVELGQPLVKDATVIGEVVEEAIKGDKLRIFRYKAKSRYRKTTGHRQTHTIVKITDIAGKKLTPAKPKVTPKPKPTPKPKAKTSPKKASQ